MQKKSEGRKQEEVQICDQRSLSRVRVSKGVRKTRQTQRVPETIDPDRGKDTITTSVGHVLGE